ncbi:MAG: RsiV family protein [Muribaculaceae bacterium]|nr:RsiV family protein [Muribaculaceae bacterium]
MNKIHGIIGVGLLALLMAGGCREEQRGNTLMLESYSFDTLAQDTMSGIEDDRLSIIQVAGSGILPVAGKDPALQLLRDSLERLAMVRFEDGKSFPRLGDELVLRREPSNSIETVCYLTDHLAVVLATPQVIVWEDFVSEYYGGAHGMEGRKFLNYSLVDKKILSLGDVILPGKMGELRRILIDHLKDSGDLLVPASSIEIPSEFHITTRGIEFVWGVYEIGPYSAGFISTEVEIYELEPILTRRGRRFFNL